MSDWTGFMARRADQRRQKEVIAQAVEAAGGTVIRPTDTPKIRGHHASQIVVDEVGPWRNDFADDETGQCPWCGVQLVIPAGSVGFVEAIGPDTARVPIRHLIWVMTDGQVGPLIHEGFARSANPKLDHQQRPGHGRTSLLDQAQHPRR